MAVKTFFIKKDWIRPNEINEKLGEKFSVIENNRHLKGKLYETSNGGVIRYYDINRVEILTFGQINNYQIKSELEEILNAKLLEPN